MSLSTTVADNAVISEEDSLRADMYDFLASLLRKEPSDELIEKVSQLEGDDTPIAVSYTHLTLPTTPYV